MSATACLTPARADQVHPVIGFIADDMSSFISLGKQGAQTIAEANGLTQDSITRFGGRLSGVIAENDDMALGAIQALRENDLLSKVVVAGVDGIKEGMRNVQSGAQLETNLQDAMFERGLAVQVAVDKVQGRPIPQSVMLIMPEIVKATSSTTTTRCPSTWSSSKPICRHW